MARLHEREPVEGGESAGRCVRRLAVPGGWLYETIFYGGRQGLPAGSPATTFVPDPAAEHCRAAAGEAILPTTERTTYTER